MQPRCALCSRARLTHEGVGWEGVSYYKGEVLRTGKGCTEKQGSIRDCVFVCEVHEVRHKEVLWCCKTQKGATPPAMGGGEGEERGNPPARRRTY